MDVGYSFCACRHETPPADVCSKNSTKQVNCAITTLLSQFLFLQSWPWGAPHLVPASRAVHSQHSERCAVLVSDTFTQRKKALFWPLDFTGTLLNAPVTCSLALRQDAGVSALFANPAKGGTHDFVTVLDDGTVLLLESAMGTMVKLFSPGMCSAARAKMDQQVLCVCATTPSTAVNGATSKLRKRHRLFVIPFNSPNNSETRTLDVPQIAVNDELQDFAVSCKLLTCLWSTGSVSVLDIPAMSHTCIVRHTLQLPQFSLPTAGNNKGVKRRNGKSPAAEQTGVSLCRVVALRDHAIAILSPRKEQKGNAVPYVVLNTLFGTVSESASFPATLPSLSPEQGIIVETVQKPSDVASAEWGSHQEVVVAAGGHVVKWGVTVKDATLANAIGSLAASSQPSCAQPNTSHALTPSAVATVLELEDVEPTQDGQQEDSKGAFVQRCDRQLVSSSVECTELYSAVQQTLALREVGSNSATVDSILTQCCDKKVLLTGGMLEKFASWLAEHKQWPALQKLVIARRLLSLGQCPCILRACAEAEQYATLIHLLRHSQDVVADDLGALLEALLCRILAGSDRASALRKRARAAAEQCCVAAEQHTTSVKVASASCACAAVDGFTGVHFVLHAVVACKLDARVIGKACEHLGTATMACMLAYLRQWVDRMLSSRAASWFSATKWCAVHSCIRVC